MGACLSSPTASSSSPPAGAAARRPRKRRAAAPTKPGKDGAAAVEFGYERDFEARYDVGRLLGHGQFGYTFAATERLSGDRVAVKRIDKAKVRAARQDVFFPSSAPQPPRFPAAAVFVLVRGEWMKSVAAAVYLPSRGFQPLAKLLDPPAAFRGFGLGYTGGIQDILGEVAECG